MIFDDFLYEVDRGRQGDNIGFSTGCPKLDSLIGGVGRATYVALGANLGVGKTAFADSAFVLQPYNQMIRNPNSRLKLRIFYYSFEISKVKKIAKWICYYIFERYGIIMDIKEVFSRKSILSDDKYRMIVSARDYIEQMMEHIHIFDVPINPTGIYKETEKYLLLNGRVEKYKKLVRGHEIEFSRYISNNPDEIIWIVEDHIGLVRGEKDLTTKKLRIDKGSEYAIHMRNFFGVSKLAISQFNREIGDLDRRRFEELTPQLEDFKDSGNTQEDADIVLSLFNPLRYNLSEYSGMNVRQLGGRYRNLVVLKNRDGSDMIKHHLNMLGEVGHFREFPEPFLEQDYIKGRNYTPWK